MFLNQVFRLLEQEAARNPVNVNNTFNLVETIRFSERIATPLVKILKIHFMNKLLLESKLKALTLNYRFKIKKPYSVLYDPKHVLEVRVLDKYQMVCTSPRCSKTIRLPQNTKFVIEDAFQHCPVVSPQEIHIMFENEIREISLEIDAILSSCGQFSAYIAANALTEKTDVFKAAFDEMTEKVIAIEGAVENSIKTSGHFYDNSALENTKENKLFAELIKTKVRYLNASAHSQQKNIDIELVVNTIETLKSLKCWSTVMEAVETHFRKYNKERASKENKLFAELIKTKVRYLNASAHSQQKNIDIELVGANNHFKI